jgi:hypothetical protein
MDRVKGPQPGGIKTTRLLKHSRSDLNEGERVEDSTRLESPIGNNPAHGSHQLGPDKIA